MNFSAKYLEECISICKQINPDKIEKMAELINSVRQDKGRIFFLGVGGGAGAARRGGRRKGRGEARRGAAGE